MVKLKQEILDWIIWVLAIGIVIWFPTVIYLIVTTPKF